MVQYNYNVIAVIYWLKLLFASIYSVFIPRT